LELRPRIHQRDEQDEASERDVAPASLVQEVSALWEEYLNGRAVGADDDFFEVGGNSLIGIKIIDRMSRDYGVELSVRAFYLAQTPARVAELIEQGRSQP
jgi:hypothetical protein